MGDSLLADPLQILDDHQESYPILQTRVVSVTSDLANSIRDAGRVALAIHINSPTGSQ